MHKSDTPLGLGSSDGLGAAVPKRNDVALWGSIVLLQLWGAVGYLKPGWLPALAGLAQLVLTCAIYFDRNADAPPAGKKSA